MSAAPTVSIDPMPDGSVVLAFAQPAIVTGSGETRRVIRDATRTQIEFQPDAWAEFVDLIASSS